MGGRGGRRVVDGEWRVVDGGRQCVTSLSPHEGLITALLISAGLCGSGAGIDGSTCVPDYIIMNAFNIILITLLILSHYGSPVTTRATVRSQQSAPTLNLILLSQAQGSIFSQRLTASWPYRLQCDPLY